MWIFVLSILPIAKNNDDKHQWDTIKTRQANTAGGFFPLRIKHRSIAVTFPVKVRRVLFFSPSSIYYITYILYTRRGFILLLYYTLFFIIGFCFKLWGYTTPRL